MDKLSEAAIEILLKIGTLSGWHVDEDNIVPVAELISSGFARASNDYDTS